MAYTNLPDGSFEQSSRITIPALGKSISAKGLRVRLKASSINLAGLPLENLILIPSGSTSSAIVPLDMDLKQMSMTYLKGMSYNLGTLKLVNPGANANDFTRFAINRFIIKTPTDLTSTAVLGIFEFTSDFYQNIFAGIIPFSKLASLSSSNFYNGNNLTASFGISQYSPYVTIYGPNFNAQTVIQYYQTTTFRMEVYAQKILFFIDYINVGQCSLSFTEDLMFLFSLEALGNKADNLKYYIRNSEDKGLLVPPIDPLVINNQSYNAFTDSITYNLYNPTSGVCSGYINSILDPNLNLSFDTFGTKTFSISNVKSLYTGLNADGTYPSGATVTFQCKQTDDNNVSNTVNLNLLNAPHAVINNITKSGIDFKINYTVSNNSGLYLGITSTPIFQLPNYNAGTYDFVFSQQTLRQYLGYSNTVNMYILTADAHAVSDASLINLLPIVSPTISLVSVSSHNLVLSFNSTSYSDIYLYYNQGYVSTSIMTLDSPYIATFNSTGSPIDIYGLSVSNYSTTTHVTGDFTSLAITGVTNNSLLVAYLENRQTDTLAVIFNAVVSDTYTIFINNVNTGVSSTGSSGLSVTIPNLSTHVPSGSTTYALTIHSSAGDVSGIYNISY